MTRRVSRADPVVVLVRYHTPNVYRAVVAWYYVAPSVAVFLAGQFLISTSRIWFARMGVRVGRRSRLPTWPLSPTADGPAIVVGEVHHPVRAIESPAPEWLTIPERGLYTGVPIVGAVGSGKTSACMHPFAHQLLSWQATNPERRAAAGGEGCGTNFGTKKALETDCTLAKHRRSALPSAPGTRTPVAKQVAAIKTRWDPSAWR